MRGIYHSQQECLALEDDTCTQITIDAAATGPLPGDIVSDSEVRARCPARAGCCP